MKPSKSLPLLKVKVNYDIYIYMYHSLALVFIDNENGPCHVELSDMTITQGSRIAPFLILLLSDSLFDAPPR